MDTRNLKKYAREILWGILIVVFIYILSSIDKEVLEHVALRLGWVGPVFIALILLLTHIFAPISGTPFYLLGIRLYGYETIVVLFYFTSMLSAAICFFIARKWGRGLVTKLVGTKSMHEIDAVASLHETTLLFVGRTLGYCFFEFTSYALALTKVPFKKYMLYTATLTLIPMSILYAVFRNADFATFHSSLIYYSIVAGTGILFALYVASLVKNRKGFVGK